LCASTVLIDERRGRQEAQSRGFSIVGTVGVLVAGQKAGLIDAQDAFDRLVRETTFRVASPLRESFIAALNATKQED
jgi:predicted nucleic acid-binding protein